MTVETFGHIDDLNTSLPAGTDAKNEGDDHIRGLKTTLDNCFANVTAAVTVTHTELNLLAGLSGVQPLDTDLTAIAALVSAADKLAYATGAGTWALADLTSFARTLLDDADAAAMRTTLDVPQTAAVQPIDADLTALAGITIAADQIIYGTGAATWATATLTSFARTLLDDADAATARATLGANNASNLTTGTVPDARLPTASASDDGIVELATSAETRTGTDTGRAVTPDGLHDMFYAVSVDASASPTFFQKSAGASGWTVSSPATGRYLITHSRGLTDPEQMIVIATPFNSVSNDDWTAVVDYIDGDSFEVAIYDSSVPTYIHGDFNVIAIEVP